MLLRLRPRDPPGPPAGPRGPTRDCARTRLEARVALPAVEEDEDVIHTQFSLWDVTSGVPDDSREAARVGQKPACEIFGELSRTGLT